MTFVAPYAKIEINVRIREEVSNGDRLHTGNVNRHRDTIYCT